MSSCFWFTLDSQPGLQLLFFGLLVMFHTNMRERCRCFGNLFDSQFKRIIRISSILQVLGLYWNLFVSLFVCPSCLFQRKCKPLSGICSSVQLLGLVLFLRKTKRIKLNDLCTVGCLFRCSLIRKHNKNTVGHTDGLNWFLCY